MDGLPTAAAAAKSLQSCPTLCEPIDGSPPGSPVPGILQARTLGWVAISFSNAWQWKVKVKSLSRVCLLVTPWTAAYQAPPSMGFSRQENWSGVPSSSLGLPELPSKIFLSTEARAKFHKPLSILDSCSLSPDTSGDNSKDWITASCFLSKFHIVSLTSVALELHGVRTTDPLCSSRSSVRPSQLEEAKS